MTTEVNWNVLFDWKDGIVHHSYHKYKTEQLKLPDFFC